jgi:hypothetical protein
MGRGRTNQEAHQALVEVVARVAGAGRAGRINNSTLPVRREVNSAKPSVAELSMSSRNNCLDNGDGEDESCIGTGKFLPCPIMYHWVESGATRLIYLSNWVHALFKTKDTKRSTPENTLTSQ